VRRLADTLDDIAGQAKLYDVTDGAIQGANRRRRTRNFGISALAIIAVSCVLATATLLTAGGGRVGPPEGGPGRLDGEPPALVQALLDTPTRGSLKDDTAYVNAVLDMIVKDPEAYGLPGERERLRVLFAGDVPGNRRLALVAGATERPRMVNLTGRTGAAAKNLELSGWSDVDAPLVIDERRSDKGDGGYLLMFGPAGLDVSVSSSPRYLADGTVQREWKPEPAGYIAADLSQVPPGMRVRMMRGNTVFYEGRTASPGTARVGELDVNPLHGRGKPAPRAAQSAADALAYSSGVSGPGIRYVVLWSDEYYVEDPNGTGTGMGEIATVMAVTPDGGGPFMTIALDASPQPNARNHPTAEGILGDPDRALLVMRMPHFTQVPPTTLQIVAPPAAVRVEVLRDGQLLATAPLTNGVGKLDLPMPLQATVRATDAQGTVVAERPFADYTPSVGYNGFEPEVKGW
jgi:hypothetical protein